MDETNSYGYQCRLSIVRIRVDFVGEKNDQFVGDDDCSSLTSDMVRLSISEASSIIGTCVLHILLFVFLGGMVRHFHILIQFLSNAVLQTFHQIIPEISIYAWRAFCVDLLTTPLLVPHSTNTTITTDMDNDQTDACDDNDEEPLEERQTIQACVQLLSCQSPLAYLRGLQHQAMQWSSSLSSCSNADPTPVLHGSKKRKLSFSSTDDTRNATTDTASSSLLTTTQRNLLDPAYPILIHILVLLMNHQFARVMEVVGLLEAITDEDDIYHDKNPIIAIPETSRLRAWEHIWDYLRQTGQLFLDGNLHGDYIHGDGRSSSRKDNPRVGWKDIAASNLHLEDDAGTKSSPSSSFISSSYATKRQRIFHQIVPKLKRCGRAVAVRYYYDVVEAVVSHPLATVEEKQYVVKASQDTLLRILMAHLGTHDGIEYYARHVSWPTMTTRTLVPLNLVDGTLTVTNNHSSSLLLSPSSFGRDLEIWACQTLLQPNPIPMSLVDSNGIMRLERICFYHPPQQQQPQVPQQEPVFQIQQEQQQQLLLPSTAQESNQTNTIPSEQPNATVLFAVPDEQEPAVEGAMTTKEQPIELLDDDDDDEDDHYKNNNDNDNDMNDKEDEMAEEEEVDDLQDAGDDAQETGGKIVDEVEEMQEQNEEAVEGDNGEEETELRASEEEQEEDVEEAVVVVEDDNDEEEVVEEDEGAVTEQQEYDEYAEDIENDGPEDDDQASDQEEEEQPCSEQDEGFVQVGEHSEAYGEEEREAALAMASYEGSVQVGEHSEIYGEEEREAALAMASYQLAAVKQYEYGDEDEDDHDDEIESEDERAENIEGEEEQPTAVEYDDSAEGDPAMDVSSTAMYVREEQQGQGKESDVVDLAESDPERSAEGGPDQGVMNFDDDDNSALANQSFDSSSRRRHGSQASAEDYDHHSAEGKVSRDYVDSDATDDEQERVQEVEKAETEVAIVGAEFGDTTEEEEEDDDDDDDHEGKANRKAQAYREADVLRARKGYASQLEEGYEPEDTHGYTEEEVSEAVHTEDEEEERRQMQIARSNDDGEDDHPSNVDLLPHNVHSSDDMDAADEHTEQEEDLGAESSELEETTEGPILPLQGSADYFPSTHDDRDPTTLLEFAQSAQRRHEPYHRSRLATSLKAPSKTPFQRQQHHQRELQIEEETSGAYDAGASQSSEELPRTRASRSSVEISTLVMAFDGDSGAGNGKTDRALPTVQPAQAESSAPIMEEEYLEQSSEDGNGQQAADSDRTEEVDEDERQVEVHDAEEWDRHLQETERVQDEEEIEAEEAAGVENGAEVDDEIDGAEGAIEGGCREKRKGEAGDDHEEGEGVELPRQLVQPAGEDIGDTDKEEKIECDKGEEDSDDEIMYDERHQLQDYAGGDSTEMVDILQERADHEGNDLMKDSANPDNDDCEDGDEAEMAEENVGKKHVESETYHNYGEDSNLQKDEANVAPPKVHSKSLSREKTRESLDSQFSLEVKSINIPESYDSPAQSSVTTGAQHSEFPRVDSSLRSVNSDSLGADVGLVRKSQRGRKPKKYYGVEGVEDDDQPYREARISIPSTEQSDSIFTSTARRTRLARGRKADKDDDESTEIPTAGSIKQRGRGEKAPADDDTATSSAHETRRSSRTDEKEGTAKATASTGKTRKGNSAQHHDDEESKVSGMTRSTRSKKFEEDASNASRDDSLAKTARRTTRSKKTKKEDGTHASQDDSTTSAARRSTRSKKIKKEDDTNGSEDDSTTSAAGRSTLLQRIKEEGNTLASEDDSATSAARRSTRIKKVEEEDATHASEASLAKRSTSRTKSKVTEDGSATWDTGRPKKASLAKVDVAEEESLTSVASRTRRATRTQTSEDTHLPEKNAKRRVLPPLPPKKSSEGEEIGQPTTRSNRLRRTAGFVEKDEENEEPKGRKTRSRKVTAPDNKAFESSEALPVKKKRGRS